MQTIRARKQQGQPEATPKAQQVETSLTHLNYTSDHPGALRIIDSILMNKNSP